ncbi:MAG TPA: hypothetical protein PKD70_07795 [Saprospiraceae bacterium]|nr:hypothetical protein [Saprospiraceae bacterium]HMP13767.1 hypothetical protein [Saprospiraceae bacterium]
MKHLSLILTISTLIACGQASKKENPILAEAAEIHAQAMRIEQTMKPNLEALIQIKNNLNIQGRALTSQEQDLITQIELLAARYAYWEENHVEVPGHEHHDHADHAHHDHDHHHGHHHNANLDLSPQDMLLVQREFLDSIRVISQSVEQLLSSAKN